MEQKRFPVFAERFAQLRGDMTQGEFAEFLGISRPTVGFYENGTRIPDALVLRQIAEKCHVSADWLIGLSNVSSIDSNIQGFCEYTGLSEVAAKNLDRQELTKTIYGTETLNLILESIHFRRLLEDLTTYFRGYCVRVEDIYGFRFRPLKGTDELLEFIQPAMIPRIIGILGKIKEEDGLTYLFPGTGIVEDE